MDRNSNKKLAAFSFFSILVLVIGIVTAILSATLAFFKAEENAIWSRICLWSGVVLIVIGVIAVLVCIGMYRHADKLQKKMDLEQEQLKTVPQAEVTYIPSREAYDHVNMGQYQSVEEKFDQISKMDKTQFVIYVARLFSRNGYQVKLTPVVDNHDVDLLVEKRGVTYAVGCLISSRILCKEDVVGVKNGRAYYGVNNSIALTNTYFDRTALEYAKAERISLIDRNVLAEDFMN